MVWLIQYLLAALEEADLFVGALPVFGLATQLSSACLLIGWSFVSFPLYFLCWSSLVSHFPGRVVLYFYSGFCWFLIFFLVLLYIFNFFFLLEGGF